MSVFLQAQKARLQKLIQTIPPAQRAVYANRVRDLEEKIGRREKLIKHPEQIKAIKNREDEYRGVS